jgi:hypothetical protein
MYTCMGKEPQHIRTANLSRQQRNLQPTVSHGAGNFPASRVHCEEQPEILVWFDDNDLLRKGIKINI